MIKQKIVNRTKGTIDEFVTEVNSIANDCYHVVNIIYPTADKAIISYEDKKKIEVRVKGGILVAEYELINGLEQIAIRLVVDDKTLDIALVTYEKDSDDVQVYMYERITNAKWTNSFDVRISAFIEMIEGK